jgi:protein-tyrosine phosphatase
MVVAAAAARQLDVRHMSFPIPDLGVIDDDAYDAITTAIELGLARGGVYIHCWGGIGRTGTVVGCVLADEGLTYDEIVTRLAALRRGSRKENRQAPEMPAQHELIKRRVASRRR